ncbi:transcriptional regulator [Paroceanicella profunda]|uniref:Transcriptional regulator n=1 Tax=Paroceanicella profunda TaxID=2579971 RepID=A0A5B8FS05_9RHOB|nr:methanogen output domain 1-containing protein [Paroceanicella profunda]QDL91546.1 transcriptional regulator [Paroceanicella profunda]
MGEDLPRPKHVPDHHKDPFLRSVLRELVGILESTVGEREAEAYINHVGLSVGQVLNEEYRGAFEEERLDLRQVAFTLVDLKARIDGGFSIESMNRDEIVLVNTACPFGDKVIGRTSLCRMTANVFGHIVAENLGYASVGIREAIARGDPRCRVTIRLAGLARPAHPRDSEFFASDQ